MGCRRKFTNVLLAFFLVSLTSTGKGAMMIIEAKKEQDNASYNDHVHSSSSSEHHRHRQRRLGGIHHQHKTAREKEIEINEKFYDMTQMTNDEKLDMIKTAHWLLRYGNDIDWDAQHDNFVQTVFQSRSHVPSNHNTDGDGSNDDGYKYNGKPDDTLLARGDIANHYSDGNINASDGLKDDTLDRGAVLTDEEAAQVVDVDGNDDAYDGNTDDTLSRGENTARAALSLQHTTTASQKPEFLQTSRRRLQSIDGDVFGGYEYSKRKCGGPGSLDVPCAPDNLSAVCNKYDRTDGSFRDCLEACSPAFCCIHDAPRDLNPKAPNCNTDENCPQYNYCYIAWWKMHDTIGPALYLEVEQDDDFYDVAADEIQGDNTGDPLYEQILLHHFDDLNQVFMDVADENGAVDAGMIFSDEEYWLYPVADKVDID